MMEEHETVREKYRSAEILCVGTELLLGDIVNTNAAFLSREMASLGIPVYRETVVGDNPERLKRAIEEAFREADLIITSGGLGPTADDLTKETFAEYFGKRMVLHEPSLEACRCYFAARGRKMYENNVKQAMMPEGAIVFQNAYGTAPALMISDEERGKAAILLPGPPRELEPLFREEVLPYLRKESSLVMVSKNLYLFGLGESEAEGYILPLMEGKNPTLAPYFAGGLLRFRATARAKSRKEAEEMVDRLLGEVQKTPLAPYVIGVDVGSLEGAVVSMLTKKGLTVATAESLTGGLISSQIASVPGASAVLLGGCVTYQNEVKEGLLGVAHETIEQYTEISGETAEEMATGVCRLLGSDLAVSATGIAGPSGGRKDAPVGTVYIGLAERRGNGEILSTSKKLSLSPMRDRDYIRSLSAMYALELLYRAAERR